MQWRIIMSTVGRVISTVGEYHQYSGRISSVQWGIFSTVVGYHEYSGRYHECIGRYHECLRHMMSTMGNFQCIKHGMTI